VSHKVSKVDVFIESFIPGFQAPTQKVNNFNFSQG